MLTQKIIELLKKMHIFTQKNDYSGVLVTSGSGDTFSIDTIDDLVEKLEEDPSQLESITKKLTGETKEMSLDFTIFEKRGSREVESESPPDFVRYKGRKMRSEHAGEFRKSLAMYLRNKFS